jgi:integration host factor subunit beta
VTKHDLIAELTVRYAPRFSRWVAARIVNAVLESLAQALARGKRIELRGFGVFTVKSRPAAAARDPRTQAVVTVPARKVPAFKIAKGLHRRINKT